MPVRTLDLEGVFLSLFLLKSVNIWTIAGTWSILKAKQVVMSSEFHVRLPLPGI